MKKNPGGARVFKLRFSRDAMAQFNSAYFSSSQSVLAADSSQQLCSPLLCRLMLCFRFCLGAQKPLGPLPWSVRQQHACKHPNSQFLNTCIRVYPVCRPRACTRAQLTGLQTTETQVAEPTSLLGNRLCKAMGLGLEWWDSWFGVNNLYLTLHGISGC